VSLALARHPRAGDLAIVGAALCFGGTFLVVQDAVAEAQPIPFLAVRFIIGALVLWPVAARRPPSPGELRDGIAGGLALLTGYLLQTIGLQYTNSATSAFITYLLVVIVPVLGIVVHRTRPHVTTVVGVALAVVGLVLLTSPGGAHGFGRGELLTLGCAFAFAVHVLVLGTTAHRHDPIRLATIQVALVGLACAVPGFWLGGYRISSSAFVAALGTGVIATAGAFALQISGQRSVPPSRAALILLLEPVSAAVLAELKGDGLRAVQLGGAALILVAILVAEVTPALLDRAVRPREADADNDRSQDRSQGEWVG
jgi:drug/metabolite transporter (DMT)-like permease